MEKQHIALTEAQIIAAEKGELQLETRDGRNIKQLVWYKPPFIQTQDGVLAVILPDGNKLTYPISGKRIIDKFSKNDLFVSETQENPAPKDLTKDFIKVGEIGIFEGVEYLGCDENRIGSCGGCDLYTKDYDCAAKSEPTPMYKVGEIIEVRNDGVWYDAECRYSKNGFVAVWINNNYEAYYEGLHRKKQTEKTVTLEGRVMTVKEAFKYLTNI